MPTHQYESIYDKQVTQYLDRAKRALDDTFHKGNNYIDRLKELGSLAAEIFLFKDKPQLTDAWKTQLELCLRKIDIKVETLVEEGIENCFVTTGNSMPDLYLDLQTGEQLFNSFKVAVEEIYGNAYQQFFDQIIPKKEQEFIDIVIFNLENGDPPFDPDNENILEATGLSIIPSKTSEWEGKLKKAWEVTKKTQAEIAIYEELSDMMLEISKDYQDNASTVQIKARANDLAFIEQCIIQIRSDESLDIAEKTNLLQGALYSISDILRKEKLKSSSIGMSLLNTQLEEIQKKMKLYDDPGNERHRNHFKQYLQSQHENFNSFNLTKKILPSKKSKSTLLSFSSGHKQSPQQTGNISNTSNMELPPPPTSRKPHKPSF